MRLCAEDGCGSPVVARGLCKRHYNIRRTADPNFIKHIYNDDKARFLSYLSSPDANGCITWQGCKDRYGYGRFKYKGVNTAAHRFYYTHIRGLTIPEGYQMAHNCIDYGADCNNKSCVVHCVPATASDNIAMDAAGENHGFAKVPDYLVIRAIEFYLQHRGQYSYSRLANLLTRNGYPTCKASVVGWVNRTGRTSDTLYNVAFRRLLND